MYLLTHTDHDGREYVCQTWQDRPSDRQVADALEAGQSPTRRRVGRLYDIDQEPAPGRELAARLIGFYDFEAEVS